MTTRGKFITVEGIDGAGKSSHLEFLADRIRQSGRETVLTREPGGTQLGESLRALVLSEPMDALTEALLMFAARREHVLRVIGPALQAGRWVVCDRFSDATYAYQCGGRELEPATCRTLETIVHPGLEPDATFVFDVEPEQAAARQRKRGNDPDRFEREETAFFRRVRAAYLDRAARAPGRIIVIDATGSLEEVRARLEARFLKVLA